MPAKTVYAFCESRARSFFAALKGKENESRRCTEYNELP